jgi:hypothetical protein
LKTGKTWIGIGAVMLALTGCSVSSLKYQGELHSRPQVEELIEDQLEAENPGSDLEVSITDDTDEDKNKKKKKTGGKK